MARATYAPDADILYVMLRDGEKIERQTFLDDLRVIDHSATGVVVGVEFMCASEGVDLGDVPFARQVEYLIGRSGHSFRILV